MSARHRIELENLHETLQFYHNYKLIYFDKRVAEVVMENKESNTFKRKKKKREYDESGGSGPGDSDNTY